MTPSAHAVISTPLRVMVVDDEQLARDELCYQL